MAAASTGRAAPNRSITSASTEAPPGPDAPELANAGQDALQTPQNEDWPPDTRGLPTRGGFEIGQDPVEAVGQVGQDVVAIEADAMPGVERSGSSPYQDAAWYQALEVAFGGQQALPVRQGLSAHGGRIA
jgi:hypothetical protein